MDVASSADFAWGTDDFTIEFRLRATTYTSTGNAHVIYDHRTAVGSTPRSTIYTLNGNLQYYVNGADRIGPIATPFTNNVWHNLAVSRVSGTTRMFLDGTQVGGDYTDATSYTAGPLILGTAGDALGSIYGFDSGWIDEIRVTKGVGRYSTDYTVDTVAFPDS